MIEQLCIFFPNLPGKEISVMCRPPARGDLQCLPLYPVRISAEESIWDFRLIGLLLEKGGHIMDMNMLPGITGRNQKRGKGMYACELMVFDLDGTLINSAPDLVAAANFTRRALNMPVMDDREIIRCVGDGTDKLVERITLSGDRDLLAKALHLFMSYYRDHLVDNSFLYPGVIEVLEFFGSKKKVIITNKRETFTRMITDHFAISSYFEDIIGMGSSSLRKPDSRMLMPCLERFHADPRQTVVVGDGVNDIELARNCGARSCALLNGFTEREILLSLGPDAACEELQELKALFC